VDRLSPFLFEDVGSPLNGGAKVCQRQLVNEVLGPFVTQFALNLAHKGATPIQRGFDGGLLGRVWAVELVRHSALRHLGAERIKKAPLPLPEDSRRVLTSLEPCLDAPTLSQSTNHTRATGAPSKKCKSLSKKCDKLEREGDEKNRVIKLGHCGFSL
jgi:hypothetical protein